MKGNKDCKWCHGTGSYLKARNLHESEGIVPCYHEKMNDEIKQNNYSMNPWHPMTKPIDLKHLGKLGEELNECGAAVSRCIIQGIDECEPVTKVINREWLENEIADVYANLYLVKKHFNLDYSRILDRMQKKIDQLSSWHKMV